MVAATNQLEDSVQEEITFLSWKDFRPGWGTIIFFATKIDKYELRIDHTDKPEDDIGFFWSMIAIDAVAVYGIYKAVETIAQTIY
jgi:hypothetical protein|tara:strand:+ start:206 stop:460 length:255 start_codon:yes stop_codon:yes gene_type:complete